METQTLETQPKSNVVAMSTASELDYVSIVKSNAQRKSNNGKTLATNKGKVSLLTACIDEVRSLLGMDKVDDNGEKTRIPIEHVEKLKAVISDLLKGELQAMVQDAESIGAAIRIRRNYLAPKFNDDKGLIDVSLKSSWQSTKEQARNSANYRMGVVISLANAEKREKQMLSSGKYTEETLAKCRRQIRVSQAILAKIDAKPVN